ncbi:MAG: DUF6524 family protein [Marinibacterium sp.]
MLLRWLFSFALIAATYNPTDWNYVRWAFANAQTQTSVVVLLGLLLVIAYIVFVRATVHSIGILGMLLVAGVVAALFWVLNDFGVLSFDNRNMNAWLGIAGLSLVLGVGLTWSHVKRRLTGQADVDDIED